MKITNLKIEKFRNLENVDFKIGKKLTIIAGRNGTGKSALLGLIGHIFDYKGKSKTLSGQKFATEFNKIFRFSLSHEKDSEYNYQVLIKDGDKEIVRDAYFNGYNETEERFRIYVGKKEKAQGKINLPVVYLGLERLFPIAQEKDRDINIKNSPDLNDADKDWYGKWYNEIFASEEAVDIEDCKTSHKRFYSPSCKLHDSFSNSAGEDNLGQILTSILSFNKIKEELGENYEGGILLIDELDATMFPGAQIKLLNTFLTFAKQYDLQIIFTTHSRDIIKLIMEDKFYRSNDVEFVFLEKKGTKINAYQTKDDIEKVLSSLCYEIFLGEDPKKIELYTEDEEARIFLKGIIQRNLRKFVDIKYVNLGAENYIHLINNKVPSFLLNIVVIDGDQKKSKNKNVLLLPGGKRPENVFYDLLNSLPAQDNFWGSYGGYTKEYFLAHPPNNLDNRTDMKNWFNSNKNYWGRGCNKVINIWKSRNQQQVDDFNKEIKDAVDYLDRCYRQC